MTMTISSFGKTGRAALAAILTVLFSGDAMAHRTAPSTRARPVRGGFEEAAPPAAQPIRRPQEECRQAVFECMDNALMAAVMESEVLFDDYNDMITELHGGMRMPPFKCAYAFELRSIFTRFHFGLSNLNPGDMRRIERNSIAYYNFLRQNALEVASRRLPVTELHPAAIAMAGITTRPEGARVQLPFADTRITVFDGEARFNADRRACTDLSHPRLAGCEGQLDGAIAAWRRADPSEERSCEEYRTFLTLRLNQSREEARLAIVPLRSRLQTMIDEHNANLEAMRRLGR